MAGRAPDKFERHTPESISHAANELEQLAARLKASVALLSIEPPIAGVDVRYETSLTDGLQFLRNWTNEVARCTADARRESAKNGRVRKTGHGSDKGSKA